MSPSSYFYHDHLCVKAIEARSVDQEKEGHVNSFTLAFRDSDKERQYQVKHILNTKNIIQRHNGEVKNVKIFRRIETLGFQHHLLAHSSLPFSWEAFRYKHQIFLLLFHNNASESGAGVASHHHPTLALPHRLHLDSGQPHPHLLHPQMHLYPHFMLNTPSYTAKFFLLNHLLTCR